MIMIILNTDQRKTVAGIYNGSFELAPEYISENVYVLPLEVLTDDNFSSIREYLNSLHQEDILIPVITIPEDST